jgi:hypothetical protein
MANFNLNNIAKRLAQVEATQAQATTTSLAEVIVQSRATHPRPRRTEAALQAMAGQPSIAGRMARGDLRLRRFGASTAPIEPDVELPQAMGEFFHDPLGFVMWAFDWGTDAAMRVVRLPEQYQLEYDSEFGPDQWACDLLMALGDQTRQRGFDGTKAVEAVRMAVASGHGIGKSAVTAWITHWIMSTRPNSRGVVTASTQPQLESKTWAQIAAWSKRNITREWWDISTGRGSMKMLHKDHPETWAVYAQTAREENAESFAGLHAADASPFYLVDEASGVPDAIHEVMQGGLTDGEPFLFAFGNPTRNTGWFHGAFHSQRHRWTTWQIDSRDVAITNKAQIQQWVDDFGVDSDFVKVRVRGVFPSASSLQFIGRDVVDGAMTRELPESRGETIVVGVDPARFGSDSSVIYTRVGRDARTWPPIRLRGVDTMQLAARTAEHVNFLRSAGHHVLINVDGGGVGGGVIDRLRSVGYEVNEVQFGSRAMDPKTYANRRAEIWGLMKSWLQVGAIAQDEDLAIDLTSPEYGYTAQDQIQLERKESMKARGLASPDTADALAVTFAVPTPIAGTSAIEHPSQNGNQEAERLKVINFNPMANIR